MFDILTHKRCSHIEGLSHGRPNIKAKAKQQQKIVFPQNSCAHSFFVVVVVVHLSYNDRFIFNPSILFSFFVKN